MRHVVKTILLAAIVVASTLSAQSQFRVYGGKYTDQDSWFAGAGYEMGLIPLITIIPNYEYVFTDVGHLYTLSVDGTMSFLVIGYAGAGIGWNNVGSNGSNSSHVAWNILGGVSLSKIPMAPFVQAKYVIFDGGGNTWAIGAGIHLGG